MNDNKIKTVICAENLSREFVDGKKSVSVLNRLNLRVLPGELVSVVGASGSGKSTLLQLLGGLDQPSSGEIYINGISIKGLSEKKLARIRNQNLGFVYQFHHLLTEFTALENVAMPCLLAGWTVKDSRKRALDLLAAVGLANRAEHKPGELSGGERQRVAFSRSLATQAGCILADEPTGNLDETTANEVFKWLLELNDKFNTSFVLVTHDHHLADQTHRKLNLQDGCLSSCPSAV